jgi:hypothetical protein
MREELPVGFVHFSEVGHVIQEDVDLCIHFDHAVVFVSEPKTKSQLR